MDLPLEPIRTPGPNDDRGDGAEVMWPCDAIEPLLGSHLDRELRRAEEVRVEEHLDTCGRCRARLEHLEALSGALKAWEAEAITPVPPDLRLRNAVLARVAETSHQRRIDDRVLRLTHFAIAACVLLALGLGIVLGAGYETPMDATPGAQGRPVAFDTQVGSLPTVDLDLQSGFDTTALKARTSLDGLARGSEADPIPDLPNLRGVPKWMISKIIAEGALREMELATGEECIVLPGRFDDAIVITRDVFNSPAGRRIISMWRPELREPASVPPPETGPQTTPTAVLTRPTGMTVKDLLSPMQGLNGDVNSYDAAPPVFTWQPTWAGEHVRRVGTVHARGIHRSKGAARPALASTDGTGRPKAAAVLDPLKAQEDGLLRILELEGDEVVVLVKGSTAPIFIPAGQLIAGGVTDRVTAEPLWIPASQAAEQRFKLACMPARRGRKRAEPTTPRLTRWIVGPSLRSLLTRGTTPAQFLDAAERQFQASAVVRDTFGSFSLVDLYRLATSRDITGRDHRRPLLDARQEWGRSLRPDGYAGFVFTRGGGEVLGVEVVRFTGDAASKLLARLWVSYQLEAWLRISVPKGDRKTLAHPARVLGETLLRLQRSSDVFEGKLDPAERVRVSRSDIATSRLGFQAVELTERDADGKTRYVPVYVSGTANFR